MCGGVEVVVVMSFCVDTTKTEGVQGSGVWYQPANYLNLPSEPRPALCITWGSVADCSSTSVTF